MLIMLNKNLSHYPSTQQGTILTPYLMTILTTPLSIPHRRNLDWFPPQRSPFDTTRLQNLSLLELSFVYSIRLVTFVVYKNQRLRRYLSDVVGIAVFCDYWKSIAISGSQDFLYMLVNELINLAIEDVAMTNQ